MNAEELAAEYDRLRNELRRLLAEPDKDMAAVARVMDQLDLTHRRYKAAHGIDGNNPID
ncbi:hypothetical protein [Piscinibacter koreensis]|uniref:Uncharacterized protein n=1 Tax=Piscinibacter koreensis TaxID=2742824 RepID=A0A7Y6NN77_9BURK|nr:hypothetical protein [Schlegelella koreensis]NUZ06172.1 hypothetical protein [Schlegelella koreensis]